VTPHVWLPALRARSGVDVFVRRLARGLERAGARATVTWFPAHCEWLPFLLGRTPPPAGAQLVHLNTWLGHAFRRWPLPQVLTLHNSCVQDHGWLDDAGLVQRAYYRSYVRWSEGRSVAAADALTAVSRFVGESLARAHPQRSAAVVYNWVDTAVFHPGPAPARAAGPFRLLFVGNFTRRKGADLLPAIAAQLGAGFELSVAGLRAPRGPARWPTNMVYIPPISREEDMAELYRRCDALLMPSRMEGFGYAPLEALACGRPVVATDASALPEVVRDGHTGLLCPMDDVGAFVAACRRLAADRPLYLRMSEAARADATARFSEQAAVSAYLGLYQSLLAPRAA
jgi:glycosyltransferase involved in cell wall biosynthesis